MSAATRRAAIVGLAGLLPLAASGKGKRRRKKRCRASVSTTDYRRCGQLGTTCETACAADEDCAGGGLPRCVDGACRYCPSAAWEYIDEPGVGTKTACYRPGWTWVQAGCAPW